MAISLATTDPLFAYLPLPFSVLDGGPTLCDVDSDGARDLLVGSSAGLVYLHNDGSDAAPQLVPRGTDFALYQSAQVQPAVGDLDGDGEPDAVMGTADGDLLMFMGPDWTDAGAMELGGQYFSGALAPALGDYNGDGLADVFLALDSGDVLAGATQLNNVTSIPEVASWETVSEGDGAGVAFCDDELFVSAGAGEAVTRYYYDAHAEEFVAGAATDWAWTYGPLLSCADAWGGSSQGFLAGGGVLQWFVNATAPVAPAEAPVATAGGAGNVTVTWAAPADDGGASVTEFTVACNSSSVAVAADGGAQQATLTDVPAGLGACTVAASNAAGDTLYAASNAVDVPLGVPAAPAPLTCYQSSETAATAAWSAPGSGGSDITGYTLTADGEDVAMGTEVLAYEVTNVAANATVRFSLVASNAEGDSEAVACETTVTRHSMPAARDDGLTFWEDALLGSNRDAAQQPVFWGDYIVLTCASGELGVVVYDADTLAPVLDHSLAGYAITAIAFGDLDGDGDDDAVAALAGELVATTLWNDGAGNFAPEAGNNPANTVETRYGPASMALFSDASALLVSNFGGFYRYELKDGAFVLVADESGFTAGAQVSLALCGDNDDLLLGQAWVPAALTAEVAGWQLPLTQLLNTDGDGLWTAADLAGGAEFVNQQTTGYVSCGGLLNSARGAADTEDELFAGVNQALQWFDGEAQVPDTVAAAPTWEDGELRWQAPASDGGDAITQYIITITESTGDYVPTRSVTGSPAAPTAWTLRSLPADANVAFAVAAVNSVGAGNASPQSPPYEVPAATGPAPADIVACWGEPDGVVGVYVEADAAQVDNGGTFAALAAITVEDEGVADDLAVRAGPAPSGTAGVPSVATFAPQTGGTDLADNVTVVLEQFEDAGASAASCWATPTRATTLGDGGAITPSEGVDEIAVGNIGCHADGALDLLAGSAWYTVSSEGELGDGQELVLDYSIDGGFVTFGSVVSEAPVDDMVVCFSGNSTCTLGRNMCDGSFEAVAGGFAAVLPPSGISGISFRPSDSDFFVASDELGLLQYSAEADYALVPGAGADLKPALARSLSQPQPQRVSFCDINLDGEDDAVFANDALATVAYGTGNDTYWVMSSTLAATLATSSFMWGPSLHCADMPQMGGVALVFARDSDHESVGVSPLEIPPSPVRAAALEPVDDASQALLSWLPPLDNGSAPLLGYNVEAACSASFYDETFGADVLESAIDYDANCADGDFLVILVSAFSTAGVTTYELSTADLYFYSGSDDDSSDDGGGLSAGAVAGIIIGVAVVVGAVGFFVHTKRAAAAHASAMEEPLLRKSGAGMDAL